MKNNNGVSLIVLVLITILIMLISLFAISIAFGDTGLVMRKKRTEVYNTSKGIETHLKTFLEDSYKEEKKEEKLKENIDQIKSDIVATVLSDYKIATIEKEKPQGQFTPSLEDNKEEERFYILIENDKYRSVVQVTVGNTVFGLLKTDVILNK